MLFLLSSVGVLNRLLHGIAGGLFGGVAFGGLMQAAGMIPMAAMLVGSEPAGAPAA